MSLVDVVAGACVLLALVGAVWLVGHPPQAAPPPDPVIAEHTCRYCPRPAVGMLRRITGKTSPWIFYCPAHLGLAVSALGVRRRWWSR